MAAFGSSRFRCFIVDARCFELFVKCILYSLRIEMPRCTGRL
jgi:hypothetical protein